MPLQWRGAMRARVDRAIELFEKALCERTLKSMSLATAFCMALAISFLYVEACTGYQIVLLPFLLIPISLATLFSFPMAGYVFCFGCTLASNLMEAKLHPEHFTAFNLLNSFFRLLVVLYIVKLLSLLRESLGKEREAAISDPLTGLANRGRFLDCLEIELADAKRYGHSLSVAYIDLDKFKQVNDNLGHAKGDEVLMEIASALSRAVRAGDLPARLGGDEFAVILPHAGPEAAEAVLKKLGSVLAERMNALSVSTCASVGLLSNCQESSSVDELIEQADALMYKAKKDGSFIQAGVFQRAASAVDASAPSSAEA